MADALIRAFATRSRLGLALACLMNAGVCAAAGSDKIADPTQPPPGYGVGQQPGGPKSVDPAPEPVRLQMIARDGVQRLAVLNGHRVRAGDAIPLDGKSAKVVQISENVVVLDRDGRRQVVELIPRPGAHADCAADSSDRAGCRSDSPGAQP